MDIQLNVDLIFVIPMQDNLIREIYGLEPTVMILNEIQKKHVKEINYDVENGFIGNKSNIKQLI